MCMLLTVWFFYLGIHMFLDPSGWYAATPGVPETGPLNTHFVRDIGAGFLMASLAYGLCLLRGAPWQLFVVGAVMPGLHGGIHFIDLITGHSHGGGWAADVFGVVLPGFLALLLAIIAVKDATNNKEDNTHELDV